MLYFPHLGGGFMVKKLILIFGLFASGFSFGADWVLVTQSDDNESNYYIDKSYYKYDSKNMTAQIWVQTENYKKSNSMEKYVSSKGLTLYDCTGKRYKNLASISYRSDGFVLNTFNQPAKDFSVIFPDTVGESYWDAACKTKGKGLYLPIKREFLNLKRLQDSNTLPKKEEQQREPIYQNWDEFSKAP